MTFATVASRLYSTGLIWTAAALTTFIGAPLLPSGGVWLVDLHKPRMC